METGTDQRLPARRNGLLEAAAGRAAEAGSEMRRIWTQAGLHRSAPWLDMKTAAPWICKATRPQATLHGSARTGNTTALNFWGTIR